PHDVRVNVVGDALQLTQDDWADSVGAALLKRIDGGGGSTLRLGRTDLPGWRLVLPVGADDELKPLLGREDKYGRWIDRIGLVPALITGGIITAIVGDFGDLRCRDAKGQQALEALVERVAPGATKGPTGIKVAALDVRMFNA